jgi:hypothetical protein
MRCGVIGVVPVLKCLSAVHGKSLSLGRTLHFDYGDSRVETVDNPARATPLRILEPGDLFSVGPVGTEQLVEKSLRLGSLGP